MAPITPIIVDMPRMGVLRITMNQPTRRHPVTPELRERILVELKKAECDPSVRAVILTGSGGHFCGGGDLERIGKTPVEDFPTYMEALSRFVMALSTFPKPIIAAVEGAAAGGGAGFALATDLIVMGHGASFTFPFFRIGLVPDAGIMFHLPRRVGHSVARRILLSASKVDAAEAERIGLADVLVADERVQDEAVDLAEHLGAQPAQAYGFTKCILGNGFSDLSDVLREERKAQIACLRSEAFAIGIDTFLKIKK